MFAGPPHAWAVLRQARKLQIRRSRGRCHSYTVCFSVCGLCRSKLRERPPSFDLVHYLGAAIGSGHGTTRTRQEGVHFGLHGGRKARDAPGLFYAARELTVAGRQRVLLYVCASGVYLSASSAASWLGRWSLMQKSRSAASGDVRRVGLRYIKVFSTKL